VRLLLDTHALLWWLGGHRVLSREARDVISRAENQVLFSAASVWEVVIKRSLGKLDVPDRFVLEALADGFGSLSVTSAHALEVAELPTHHRDPFDRMLIAQARVEGLSIVSRDERFDGYGVERIW
jgi:PIN domain nuclease of toxin-antitoxin system